MKRNVRIWTKFKLKLQSLNGTVSRSKTVGRTKMCKYSHFRTFACVHAYVLCTPDTTWWLAGMWSWSRRLGLKTVSRRTNVSSRSRLGQSAQRLGLVSISDLCVSGLVSVSAQKVSASRLGPFRLVETFRAGTPCITSVLQYKLVWRSP